jgi:hypothetical protein
MGERKVINKYFPPDFDHTKIPRPDKRQQERLKERFVVRMMLPMSVRCMTCGEYMYKGKKFNSRKENVEGPDGDYLGIQILRFYFKCVTCSAEFTIKTDPKNEAYVVEGGAKANFELYKEEKKERDELAAERAEGEKYDTMKALENKTEESKRAMDILDALDEIRTNNARAASVKIDDVLSIRQRQLQSRDAEAASAVDHEDELAAAAAFAAARTKRLRDDDDDDAEDGIASGDKEGQHATRTSAQPQTADLRSGGAAGSSTTGAPAGKAAAKRPKLPIGVIVQPKAAAPSAPGSGAAAGSSSAPTDVAAGGGGLLGLGAYDSSGSSSGDDAAA